MQEQLIGDGQTGQPQLLGKSIAREIRMGFVRKVYAILSFQLLLTTVIAYPVMQLPQRWILQHMWVIYVALAVQIACMCVISCAQSQLRTFPQNYCFLFLFTATEGVMIGLICSAYTAQSVAMAASATVLIFLMMTAYAWTTKSDFTGMGPYLVGALCSLFGLALLFGLLSMMGVDNNVMHGLNFLYGACSVLIFTFFIIFDTQKMLGEWGGHKVQFNVDDYCYAALNLYLDIINLFLQLLRMFGDKK